MDYACPFCGSNDVTEREDHSGLDCENCWQFIPMQYIEEWEAHNHEK